MEFKILLFAINTELQLYKTMVFTEPDLQLIGHNILN